MRLSFPVRVNLERYFNKKKQGRLLFYEKSRPSITNEQGVHVFSLWCLAIKIGIHKIRGETQNFLIFKML